MTDSSGTKKNKDGHICYWCGAHFQPSTPQKRPVCPRCYRLLSSAGLKDEEIFAPEKPAEDEGGGEG